MTFERSMIGEIHVLTPKKNLVGGNETKSLTAAIEETAAAIPAKVVLDLRKISWVSSSGLTALNQARITCVNSQGWLRFVGIGKVGKIRVGRSGIEFDAFSTVEEAIAAED